MQGASFPTCSLLEPSGDQMLREDGKLQDLVADGRGYRTHYLLQNYTGNSYCCQQSLNDLTQNHELSKRRGFITLFNVYTIVKVKKNIKFKKLGFYVM